MKIFQKTAQQAIWLLAIAVVIVAAILIFPRLSSGLQGPATANSQSTQTDSTQTPVGYPGPESSSQPITQADATQTPAGYPGSESTRLSPDITSTSVDYLATEFVEATASAQAAPSATPVVLVGPRTLIDSTGQYSLDIPEGWRATALGDTILTNYDDGQLQDVYQFPPGGIKIELGIDNLKGRTLNEWLDTWITSEASNEVAGPDITFTEVQPYILGPYEASEYYVTTPVQFIREIAFDHNDRVIIIGITPADSLAMDEALKILSTILFVPN